MTLETGAGEVRYDLSVPELSTVTTLYDVPLAGKLGASGTATLPDGGAPRVAGDLTLAGLSYDGTTYGNLALGHDVTVSDTPSGQLRVNLRQSPYGDVRLTTGFAYDQPTLTLDGLDLSALGLTASGDLRIATDGPLVDGTLQVRASDLSAAGRTAGTPLRGTRFGHDPPVLGRRTPERGGGPPPRRTSRRTARGSAPPASTPASPTCWAARRSMAGRGWAVSMPAMPRSTPRT